jgi:hypothetical protein
MNKIPLLIAIAAAAVPLPARAVEMNSLMSKPATPSILYVGFDKMDAAGNPVCESCKKQDADKDAQRKAFFARRELPVVMRPETQTANAAPAPSVPATSSQPDMPARNVPAPQPDPTLATAPNTMPADSDGVMRGALR